MNLIGLQVPALILVCVLLLGAGQSLAVVLWSDLGATLADESGAGVDLLGGTVRRDDAATNTLYFKFHVDPISDVSTEEYFAAFQLFEGDSERLALGNSLKAWAYSAFKTAETGTNNRVFGDLDLRSARREPSAPGVFLPYELPRRGTGNTLVFKVEYRAGQDDLVTVWVNPMLGPGATESEQSPEIGTTFRADASFDQIRLRHGGGGGGWTFSDMAIATSFSDLAADVGGGPGESVAGGRDRWPLTFRSWQREQGLPQNPVRALAQTADGYLWIGSEGGVARFDGVRFFTLGMREGLRTSPVNCLCGDRSGALWIGTSGGGLARWHEGKLINLARKDGLPADSVTALAQDHLGRLWIGTESGLVIWHEGRLSRTESLSAFDGRAVRALFQDDSGVMWVGATAAGVFSVADGKATPVKDASVDSLLNDPHCLLRDKAGRLWVGAGDDYVLCRDGVQWHRYRIPRHLARPLVGALAEAPDGTVWAGSVSEGLFQFKEGKLTAVNASSGLSDNFVESLLVDREGNLWAGTAAGLNRLRRGNLAVLGQGEGLGHGVVRGLAEVREGSILVGKLGDGLYRWGGKSFGRLLTAGSFPPFLEVNSLLEAPDEDCWVAGARGLWLVGEAGVRPTALAGRNVISLAAGREGSGWAGTREGELWRRQGSEWQMQTNRFTPHAVTAIAEGQDGTVWVGTDGGGLQRMPVTGEAGPVKLGGLASDIVRTIHLDMEGALWIGTDGGGLSRLRGGRVNTFTAREGLPDNTISQILEDDEGRLWLGGNRGIACVSKPQLEALAAGNSTQVYPHLYGRWEGMAAEECTGGFFPAGLRTQSGLLWFPTLKGIVVVDPRRPLQGSPAPVVLLEEVLLDGDPVSSFGAGSVAGRELVDTGETDPARKRGLRIPPGRHRLELRYTGLSFDAPERVRFKYRLEGLDANWVDAGTERTAVYNYVPPGDYRFRVAACNRDGFWNEAGAALALSVQPFYWQTWWFLTLAGAGLVLLVGGTVRVVEKRNAQRRVKALVQERALQRERERIARDLHDDLGSSLARISLLSGLVKADKHHSAQVEAHAEKIAQSADETVRALEEIVWAVRPDSDSLQSLMDYIAHFATELFEGNGTRCRLDIPHELPGRALPPDLRHNIFLVVKEALTNVLKHAAANEVRVQAKATAGSLEIQIEDAGQGFDAAAARQREEGHGLANMRRRAEAVGGTLFIQSAPGSGTKVRLVVKFRGDARVSGVTA